MENRKHPLVAIREELGISRREFGLMCGLSYNRVYAVETGSLPWIPRRIVRALDRLGYDIRGFLEAHWEWLESEGELVWERLGERIR